jgi:hypothetical protein
VKKDFEKIIHNIEEGLSEVQQESLFGSDSTYLENACVDYLRYKGYSVRKPLIHPYEIKKLNDLISLFYVLLSKHNKDDELIYKNEKQDLKIAKSFVEVIQNVDGLSKQVAMKQCGRIIQIVFKNIDRFKFNIPLTFGIFGQRNMGWVTELAIKIINEEIAEYKELMVEKRIDEMMSRYSKEEDIGWSDDMIDTVLKKQKEN